VSALQASSAPPVVLARSFHAGRPRAARSASDWDWYQGFTGRAATLGTDHRRSPVARTSTAAAGNPLRSTSALYRLDEPNNVMVLTYGSLLGQLWVAYDDYGQDTTGKVRFTALQKANVELRTRPYVSSRHDVGRHHEHRSAIPRSSSSRTKMHPFQEGLAKPNNNTLLIQPIHRTVDAHRSRRRSMGWSTAAPGT
jgi:hypothetical protein